MCVAQDIAFLRVKVSPRAHGAAPRRLCGVATGARGVWMGGARTHTHTKVTAHTPAHIHTTVTVHIHTKVTAHMHIKVAVHHSD